MKRYIVGILALALSVGAQAQIPGKFAWQDIGLRLKASQAVAPLGPSLSGEQVSLSNGARGGSQAGRQN